jgi:hypothetical protein
VRDLKPSKVRCGPCAARLHRDAHTETDTSYPGRRLLRQHAMRTQCATIKFGHVSCIDDDSQALCNTYGVECPWTNQPLATAASMRAVPARAWSASRAASRSLSAHYGAFNVPTHMHALSATTIARRACRHIRQSTHSGEKEASRSPRRACPALLTPADDLATSARRAQMRRAAGVSMLAHSRMHRPPCFALAFPCPTPQPIRLSLTDASQRRTELAQNTAERFLRKLPRRSAIRPAHRSKRAVRAGACAEPSAGPAPWV